MYVINWNTNLVLAVIITFTIIVVVIRHNRVLQRKQFCSAYSCTFLRSVICLSVCLSVTFVHSA